MAAYTVSQRTGQGLAIAHSCWEVLRKSRDPAAPGRAVAANRLSRCAGYAVDPCLPGQLAFDVAVDLALDLFEAKARQGRRALSANQHCRYH